MPSKYGFDTPEEREERQRQREEQQRKAKELEELKRQRREAFLEQEAQKHNSLVRDILADYFQAKGEHTEVVMEYNFKNGKKYCYWGNPRTTSMILEMEVSVKYGTEEELFTHFSMYYSHDYRLRKLLSEQLGCDISSYGEPSQPEGDGSY